MPGSNPVAHRAQHSYPEPIADEPGGAAALALQNQSVPLGNIGTLNAGPGLSASIAGGVGTIELSAQDCLNVFPDNFQAIDGTDGAGRPNISPALQRVWTNGIVPQLGGSVCLAPRINGYSMIAPTQVFWDGGLGTIVQNVEVIGPNSGGPIFLDNNGGNLIGKWIIGSLNGVAYLHDLVFVGQQAGSLDAHFLLDIGGNSRGVHVERLQFYGVFCDQQFVGIMRLKGAGNIIAEELLFSQCGIQPGTTGTGCLTVDGPEIGFVYRNSRHQVFPAPFPNPNNGTTPAHLCLLAATVAGATGQADGWIVDDVHFVDPAITAILVRPTARVGAGGKIPSLHITRSDASGNAGVFVDAQFVDHLVIEEGASRVNGPTPVFCNLDATVLDCKMERNTISFLAAVNCTGQAHVSVTDCAGGLYNFTTCALVEMTGGTPGTPPRGDPVTEGATAPLTNAATFIGCGDVYLKNVVTDLIGQNGDGIAANAISVDSTTNKVVATDITVALLDSSAGDTYVTTQGQTNHYATQADGSLQSEVQLRPFEVPGVAPTGTGAQGILIPPDAAVYIDSEGDAFEKDTSSSTGLAINGPFYDESIGSYFLHGAQSTLATGTGNPKHTPKGMTVSGDNLPTTLTLIVGSGASSNLVNSTITSGAHLGTNNYTLSTFVRTRWSTFSPSQIFGGLS